MVLWEKAVISVILVTKTTTIRGGICCIFVLFSMNQQVRFTQVALTVRYTEWVQESIVVSAQTLGQLHGDKNSCNSVKAHLSFYSMM